MIMELGHCRTILVLNILNYFLYLEVFYPVDNSKNRNDNVLAGTVVDQGINHPVCHY